MPVKAVTFDAYGTLLRNEDMRVIPRRIVADHGLSVRSEDVYRVWIDLYYEATQLSPFRTLREIQGEVFSRVLRQFDVGADAAPYVDLFFEVTTTAELYPETLNVLNALGLCAQLLFPMPIMNTSPRGISPCPFSSS
jgi:FMN phosphatase YigB (HAD superfamily)